MTILKLSKKGREGNQETFFTTKNPYNLEDNEIIKVRKWYETNSDEVIQYDIFKKNGSIYGGNHIKERVNTLPADIILIKGEIL